MGQPRVLLQVDDGELRSRYEGILRFCGFEPVPVRSVDRLDSFPDGVVAGCVRTDHRLAAEMACEKLLAAAVPVVRIDPHIRRGREHLPFEVVLPATSEPRELIAALRHLVPQSAPPA